MRSRAHPSAASRIPAAIFFAIACLLIASGVEAQDRWSRPQNEPNEQAIQRARNLFVQGMSAVESGRWAEALRNFERSYAISGVAAALYNVGTSLRALGRHREARDAFAQLLRDHEDIDPELAQSARALRAEESARVAALVLDDLPRAQALSIRLDEENVPDPEDRPLRLEANPGPHALRIELDEHEPFSWRGILRDGQRLNLRVRLPPIESSSIFENPLFWIITGVVVAAGCAIGAYAIYDHYRVEPTHTQVIRL